MLFVASLLVRTLARLLAGSRSEGAEDVEIPVLRHQVRVLRRTCARPKLRPLDCVILAVSSRALPRGRWASFMVTPQTLLRWHRELGAPQVDVRASGSAASFSVAKGIGAADRIQVMSSWR
jgi:hypothetical protein